METGEPLWSKWTQIIRNYLEYMGRIGSEDSQKKYTEKRGKGLEEELVVNKR